MKIRCQAEPETETADNAEALKIAKEQTVVQAKAQALLEANNPRPVVHRQSTGGQPVKKEFNGRHSLGSTPGFQAVNADDVHMTPTGPYASNEKPGGVLIGYWIGSSEQRLENKHAVYGTLGGSDCFRVKVTRVTRDGRYVNGNFPTGAGGLWLHYDQVILDDPLQGMTRPQIKEYVRIRLQDQEVETDAERRANEERAIKEAKERAPADGLAGMSAMQLRPAATQSPDMELRHSARSEHRMVAKQQAEAEAAAEERRKEKAAARELQHEQTRREVAQAEAGIQGAAEAELKHNVKKLNKIWVAQQVSDPLYCF